jgi:hypothetical protein
MRRTGLRHIAEPTANRGWTTSQQPSRNRNNKECNLEITPEFQKEWEVAPLAIRRWHVAVVAVTARHLRSYLSEN